MNTIDEIITALDRLTPEPPDGHTDPMAVAEQGAALVAKRQPLFAALAAYFTEPVHENLSLVPLAFSHLKVLRQKLLAIQDRHNRWLVALESARSDLLQKILAVKRLEHHEEAHTQLHPIVDMEI